MFGGRWGARLSKIEGAGAFAPKPPSAKPREMALEFVSGPVDKQHKAAGRTSGRNETFNSRAAVYSRTMVYSTRQDFLFFPHGASEVVPRQS